MTEARALVPIRGAGGKGGGGGAKEAEDTLRSLQRARLLDALCEGEIEGLVDGLRSVYLNDVVLQEEDGTFNFENVRVETRVGTQAQSWIPGFDASASEVAVGAELKADTPVTRNISDTTLEAVRVTLGIPQLTKQSTKTGDIDGTHVEIAIDLQVDGGGYQQVIYDRIEGKTISRYQRSYLITLPDEGPWDIRLRRETPDSEQSNLQNKTYWDSYTELRYAKLRYPNTALVAIECNAEEFTSLPRRGYDIKGLRVSVPSNYDPLTRTYDGIWDGTFDIAWTDNPAWCFFDLLTSERYGLGAYLDVSQVDKWTLYSIGQYCDELVPDGRGGTEPRYTCNLYLQSRQEAYSVLQQMASIFRAMPWWQQGALTTVQDAPSDPVALFTAANVIDGAFGYQGSSLRQRHTVALVAWADPEDHYRQRIEYVEDQSGIARWGVRETELIAVGCTSRGQANRLGRWTLLTERLEADTVTFRAGLDAALVYPGAVIQVMDPARGGRRYGGRVVSADVWTVQIDAELTLEDGVDYRLSVVMPDGSVESRDVATPHGTVTALTGVSVLPDAPQAGSIWVLAASNLVPTTWRVVSLSEADPGVVEITALAHRPDKYAAVEQDLVLGDLPYTQIRLTPPANLILIESLAQIGQATVVAKAHLGWDSQLGVARYEVRWRRSEQNWEQVTTDQPFFDIVPITPGSYEIRVIAIDVLGRRSRAAILKQKILGKRAPPASVSNFRMAVVSGLAQLTCDDAEDLDVLIGGKLRIRHSSATSGATWAGSIHLRDAPGAAATVLVPLFSGTYLAKWVDSGGRESSAAVGVSTTASSVLDFNVVEEWEAHPDWDGDLSNCSVDDEDRLHFEPSSLGLGAEYVGPPIDIGSVMTVRLSAAIDLVQFDSADNVGDRDTLVSTWPLVSDLTPDDATLAWAVPYVRTSEAAAYLEEWGEWEVLTAGDWRARAFQFRLVLVSTSHYVGLSVSAFTVTLDIPDLIQAGDQISSGTSAKDVTFDRPFMELKALAITAENMATGDYYTITNRAVSGFTIAFKNAAGTGVSRTFDYIAKGY